MMLMSIFTQFTFQGTNTYLIGTGHERLIIDTGGGVAEWADLIALTLKMKSIRISHVLLTHWHGDHTGGVSDLLRLFPDLRGTIYKHTPDSSQQPIEDGQRFSVEGATIRAVHTPGHSEDHMCFVLEEENSLFTGDNILGQGTSVAEDLGTFMESLRIMQNQNCATGHPAHGSTILDLPTKITQDLTAKTRRERQVLQVLNRIRKTEMSLTVSDLVIQIYGAGLNKETVKLALEPFIDQVLKKLANSGKVAFEKRRGVKKWFSLEAPKDVSAMRLTTVYKTLSSRRVDNTC
jgi:glyoxylase-like metal-dependent hydrolase (beta-lactamase superfamily II)